MTSYEEGLILIGRLKGYSEWQEDLKNHIRKLEDEKREIAETFNKILSNKEDMTAEQWEDLCDKARPHF